MSEKQLAKGSSHIFVVKGKQILLQRRYNTGYLDGYYGVPAGHIDGREHASTAAIRELKEEANVTATKNQLKQVLAMHGLFEPGAIFWHIFFECKDFEEKQINNNEPHKCDDLSWFDLDNLPEKMVDHVRVAIQGYINGVTYLEYDVEDR